MGGHERLIATTVWQEAIEAGITLAANEGKVRITGPQPPSWLLEAIKTHRAALLSILSSRATDETETSSTPKESGVSSVCDLENWLTRHHPTGGRTVHYDADRHDGSLLTWPGEASVQIAHSTENPDDLAGWSAKRGRPVPSAKAPPAARFDAVKRFIGSECEEGPTRCVGADELYRAFDHVAGSKCPLERRQFDRVLVHLGYQRFSAAGMRWRGLALIRLPAHYAGGAA